MWHGRLTCVHMEQIVNDTIKALKVGPGEAVLLQLPFNTEQGSADKLAFQVRRSWPGVPVLIVAGEVEVSVVEYPRTTE